MPGVVIVIVIVGNDISIYIGNIADGYDFCNAFY